MQTPKKKTGQAAGNPKRTKVETEGEEETGPTASYNTALFNTVTMLALEWMALISGFSRKKSSACAVAACTSSIRATSSPACEQRLRLVLCSKFIILAWSPTLCQSRTFYTWQVCGSVSSSPASHLVLGPYCCLVW